MYKAPMRIAKIFGDVHHAGDDCSNSFQECAKAGDNSHEKKSPTISAVQSSAHVRASPAARDNLLKHYFVKNTRQSSSITQPNARVGAPRLLRDKFTRSIF
jgi:hypothetical protein